MALPPQPSRLAEHSRPDAKRAPLLRLSTMFTQKPSEGCKRATAACELCTTTTVLGVRAGHLLAL